MGVAPPPRFERTHGVAQAPVAGAAAASQLDWMFGQNTAAPIEEQYLVALAATMNEGFQLNPPPASRALPAGYTYLGQFIDHDLTFDKRLFQEQPRPVRPVENLRTPLFDLDSLYGGGPAVNQALYESDGVRLKVDPHDLLRRADGSAVIEDRRNDSNRIVSQMHLGFAKFHNRVAADPGRAAVAFDTVREEVVRHYQWIALKDFLPRIVGNDLVGSILASGLRLFTVGAEPKMPFEFSAAAFRFGHSLVRAAYNLNQGSGRFFTFDAADPGGDTAEDLRGFRPLPQALAIDWDFFFAMPGGNRGVLQAARPINTLVAGPLFQMPIAVAQHGTPEGRRLPFRTLHRGEIDLRLASGQDVVHAMRQKQVPGAAALKTLGIDVPLVLSHGEFTMVGESASNLGNTGIDIATLQAKLQGATPLSYYILKEAELAQTGRLGPVGGRIVAETIIGLLLSDPASILTGAAGWTPIKNKFGCREDGQYTIADLLAYAGGS